MPPQRVKPLVTLATLIAIELLPMQPLDLLLKLLQRGVALGLVPFQAVHPRVRPVATVATKLLMGFHVLPKDARLHGVQDGRVAQQIIHGQLAVERDLAYLHVVLLIFLRVALRLLTCKEYIEPLQTGAPLFGIVSLAFSFIFLFFFYFFILLFLLLLLLLSFSFLDKRISMRVVSRY